MTVPTPNISLGKTTRLYVANAATTAQGADSAFTMVVNENDVTISAKADVDSVSTKSGGKITIPNGDVSYTLKGSADIVFADPALATLISSFNQAWQYQTRDTSVSPAVVTHEGAFVLNDLEFAAPDKGARKVTFSMENSSVISVNTPSRAVTGS